jgi:DNA-binding transcriptional ArsR family regulator
MPRHDPHVDAVFHALADPTRRRLLGELAERESATATELAVGAPVSRQAVVKHLQSLGAAGLVAPTRDGREVRYAITPDPLDDAMGWMLAVGAQWDRRLGRLQRRLGRPPRAT